MRNSAFWDITPWVLDLLVKIPMIIHLDYENYRCLYLNKYVLSASYFLSASTFFVENLSWIPKIYSNSLGSSKSEQGCTMYNQFQLKVENFQEMIFFMPLWMTPSLFFWFLIFFVKFSVLSSCSPDIKFDRFMKK